MFCPSCGKEAVEGNAFCQSCGLQLSGQPASTISSGPKLSFLGFLVLVLLIVLIVVMIADSWNSSQEQSKERAADRAIDAAVEACAQGGRQEFDRRMVEAHLAINDVDAIQREIFEAKLDNRLIEIGCRQR